MEFWRNSPLTSFQEKQKKNCLFHVFFIQYAYKFCCVHYFAYIYVSVLKVWSASAGLLTRKCGFSNLRQNRQKLSYAKISCWRWYSKPLTAWKLGIMKTFVQVVRNPFWADFNKILVRRADWSCYMTNHKLLTNTKWPEKELLVHFETLSN